MMLMMVMMLPMMMMVMPVMVMVKVFTFWLPMSSRLFLIRCTSLLNWFFSSNACIRSFRCTWWVKQVKVGEVFLTGSKLKPQAEDFYLQPLVALRQKLVHRCR